MAAMVNTEAAARLLGVSCARVRKLIQDGLLQAERQVDSRAGKLIWLITLDSIEARRAWLATATGKKGDPPKFK